MIARRLFSPIASVCACAVHQQQFSCRVLAASKRAYSSASVGDQQAERRGNHRSRRRRWLLGAALGIALGITWHFDSIENYSADYIILYSRFAKQFLSAWAIIRSRLRYISHRRRRCSRCERWLPHVDQRTCQILHRAIWCLSRHRGWGELRRCVNVYKPADVHCSRRRQTPHPWAASLDFLQVRAHVLSSALLAQHSNRTVL